MMRPVLFEIMGVEVYTYGLLLSLAFILCTYLGMLQARRKGISGDDVFDLGVVVTAAAVIGSRLLFILLNLGEYIGDPKKIFYVREGGLSFFGGLAAAIVAGVLFCRKRGLPAWALSDIAATVVPLGYTLVRIGCLMNGCCYGIESDLPWAMQASALDNLYRHPTQLYSALSALIIWGIIWKYREHRQFEGFLLFLYGELYVILRFIVEIFREGERLLGPLSLAQLFCIVASVVILFVIAILNRKLGRRSPSTELSGGRAFDR